MNSQFNLAKSSLPQCFLCLNTKIQTKYSPIRFAYIFSPIRYIYYNSNYSITRPQLSGSHIFTFVYDSLIKMIYRLYIDFTTIHARIGHLVLVIFNRLIVRVWRLGRIICCVRCVGWTFRLFCGIIRGLGARRLLILILVALISLCN